MADHTIIPPVTRSRPIPKSRRPVPANQDKQKRRQQQTPEHKPDKDGNDRPSIDEYA